jgi:HSP20 family protein
MLDRDLFDLEPVERPVYRPAVNLYETKERYVIEAELAGAHKEDIGIDFSGDTLRIFGTRKPVQGAENRRYHAAEIYFGPFERRIIIRDSLDARRIKSTFKSGLLRVEIPKKTKKVVNIEIEEG